MRAGENKRRACRAARVPECVPHDQDEGLRRVTNLPAEYSSSRRRPHLAHPIPLSFRCGPNTRLRASDGGHLRWAIASLRTADYIGHAASSQRLGAPLAKYSGILIPDLGVGLIWPGFMGRLNFNVTISQDPGGSAPRDSRVTFRPECVKLAERYATRSTADVPL